MREKKRKKRAGKKEPCFSRALRFLAEGHRTWFTSGGKTGGVGGLGAKGSERTAHLFPVISFLLFFFPPFFLLLFFSAAVHLTSFLWSLMSEISLDAVSRETPCVNVGAFFSSRRCYFFWHVRVNCSACNLDVLTAFYI